MLRYYWILFLFFFYTMPTIGQKYAVSIKQFTEKDGLSSNGVLAVVKDTRSVIWVGTKYGLNRFDGKFFKVFTTQDGLYSNYIDRIFVDKSQLWLFYVAASGSKNNLQNIDIFNIYTQKVMPFKEYFAGKLPFALSEVVRCELIEKAVLFELRDKRGFIYTPEKGFERIRANEGENLIYVSAKGNFWFTRQHGDKLYVFKKNKQGVQIGKSIALPNSAQRTLIHVLFETQSGEACFAVCEDCGVGKKEDNYRLTVSDALQLKNKFITRGLEAIYLNALYVADLDIMCVTNKETLVACDLQGREVFREEKAVTELNSILRQSLVDNQTIWQCSHSGLYRIELKRNYFYHHFPNQQFRNIVRAGERLYFNSEKGAIETDNALVPKYVIPFYALSGRKAADGNLWLANFNQLCKYTPQTQQLNKYPIPCHEPWGIYEDESGKVWLSQSGVSCFDPTTKQTIEVKYNDFEELKRNTVYHFFPLNSTEILLCATSGIYKMNLATQTITARYSSESSAGFRLPTNDFRHLYFDKKANIFWLATGQNGLLRWNPATNECKTFTFYNSIANVVHGVYADDFGFLWLSTESGIIQFHKKTHRFKIYTTKDGLPTNEFNRISHFQDRDGTLYFGSVTGVVSFHPKYFKSSFYKKEKGTPFVVEVSQYLGKTNRLEQVTADFEQQKKVYLRPDDRFFTLKMGLKEYGQADAARYFFKLNGDTDDWAEAESNQITLGRLPYGNQTLLVKTLLENGQFSENIATVPLFVKRPFYVTWWFVVLASAVVGGVVYWRITEVQKRNVLLEQEVEQRTQIIKQQTAELQQLDELKSRFFANISHELRTPLTLILNPLNSLLKNKKFKKEDAQQLLAAQKNSQKLLRLVNEILDLTKLEAATLNIETQEIELLGFIRRIAAEFESFAARKNVVLKIEHSLSETVSIATDIKKVETILYNFIGNGLKFTPQNGEILIRITVENHDLQIEVSDTGRGIKAEDLPYIFDRFYQSKTNGTSEGGSGLGLALSRELAQLLKGAVWARSEWEKGSRFFLRLPEVVLTKKIGVTNTQTVQQSIISVENYVETDAQNEVEKLAIVAKKDRYQILLVEDNFDLQDYISTILGTRYEVIVKSDGKEAFDYLENLATAEALPHLILSDVMMPIMDGYQLLNLLKTEAKYQKIPVIMLTARAGLEDRLKALRIGVDDYLTKPFVEIELLTRIENLLKNAASRKQAQTEMEEEGGAEAEGTPSEWLKEVETLIYQNMAKPDFSIEALSEMLGISRQKLNRDIKKEVGVTTLQYFQEIKFQYARKMLEEGKVQSVKAVAEHIGITDIKHFSRLFKTRFGRLPSEYLT